MFDYRFIIFSLLTYHMKFNFCSLEGTFCVNALAQPQGHLFILVANQYQKPMHYLPLKEKKNEKENTLLFTVMSNCMDLQVNPFRHLSKKIKKTQKSSTKNHPIHSEKLL